MSKKQIVILIISITILGYFYSMRGESGVLYRNEEQQISFYYPSDYFSMEKEIGNGEREHFVVTVVEDTAENRAVFEGRAPAREGPTAITVDIFQNFEKLDPLSWVKGTSDSLYKMGSGEYKEVTIAGFPAISYSWDGLYRGDSIVTVANERVYMISVTYLTPDDRIRSDVQTVLESLRLE